MLKRLIPSPSMAVALVALFVALSGSSYAAVTLHRNSVTTREIKDRSVKLADLDPAIRPSKNSKLFRTAVADTVNTDQVLAALSGAVEGDPGPAGTAGAIGATGATGAQGAKGEPGITVSLPSAVNSPVQGVGAGGFQDIQVDCPSDKSPVGGTGTAFGSGSITISERVGNGWHVRLTSNGGAASAIATVYCA